MILFRFFVLFSVGYQDTEQQLTWTTDQIEVDYNDIKLTEFIMSSLSASRCDKIFSTGNFSCVQATFKLRRMFEYYLVQLYIPSVLIVILSWVSFWIDIQAVPARVTLGLLTVLTITTQQSGVTNKLPR